MTHKLTLDTDNPIAEIIFVVAVTFVPMLLAALFATAGAGGNYFDNLFGFFQAGELGLYILSLCGTIGWLMVKTKLNLNGENYWLVGLLIFAIVTAAGTIGTNPKFEEKLVWFLNAVLIAVYLITIWGWHSAIKFQLESQSKYEKASRGLDRRDPVKSEQTTIENIIGASDD